jgi:hypothetical protein
MASLLKTLKSNASNTEVGKTDGDKYNPDVANLYNETNEIRNTTKYELSGNGYKVISEKLPTNIKSKDDLKIEYQKLNEFQTAETLKKIAELENERNVEKEKLNKQIDHGKKLEELIKIKRKDPVDNFQASTHVELKQIQINNNDRAFKEKQKFNSIVSELNNILNN